MATSGVLTAAGNSIAIGIANQNVASFELDTSNAFTGLSGQFLATNDPLGVAAAASSYSPIKATRRSDGSVAIGLITFADNTTVAYDILNLTNVTAVQFSCANISSGGASCFWGTGFFQSSPTTIGAQLQGLNKSGGLANIRVADSLTMTQAQTLAVALGLYGNDPLTLDRAKGSTRSPGTLHVNNPDPDLLQGLAEALGYFRYDAYVPPFPQAVSQGAVPITLQQQLQDIANAFEQPYSGLMLAYADRGYQPYKGPSGQTDNFSNNNFWDAQNVVSYWG